jgi:hypothetical protein
MELKEMIQKLVETDDKMQRLQIVEENAALMDGTPPDTTEIDTLRQQFLELQNKYVTRFFGGNPGDEKPKEDEKPEENLTIDDLKL